MDDIKPPQVTHRSDAGPGLLPSALENLEDEMKELATASDPQAILTAIKNSEREGSADAKDAATPRGPKT